MKDWNVVVTVTDRIARHRARRGLSAFGEVASTQFHNVLVMRVDNVETFLTALDELMGRDMTLFNDISRLIPAQETFNFETWDEFQEKALAIILRWADRIAGKSFHIRLHRRGLSDDFSASAEEKRLDAAMLGRLNERGQPGRISFHDSDFVIDIETVANRSGLSLWERAKLRHFPFLRVD